MGRTFHTTSATTELLLLTDINSQIPVFLGDTKEYAILAGDTTPSPVLKFLRMDAVVNVGDRVFTSGQGGLFPSGLFIGTVAQVKPVVKVSLHAEVSTSYVNIIKHSFVATE